MSCSQQLRGDTGLFRHSFVREAVRITAFLSMKSVDAKHCNIFNPTPIGLIAYALTIVSPLPIFPVCTNIVLTFCFRHIT